MLIPDVLVIGAGLSGLTTAVCLAEAGRAVRVIAQTPPLRTTSAVAGASWGPYMVSDPRVLDWSKETRIVLQQIAAMGATTGVRMTDGLETDVDIVEPPAWAQEADGFRLCVAGEFPAIYATGWRYTIPIADMRAYLGYLVDRLATSGVTVSAGTVSSFAQVAGDARVIVNCTGLGSRELVPDATVFPTRGQLVVVENPGIDWFFQDNVHGDELTYFLPHGDHVVLGGSAIEHASHITPVEEIAAGIIARCAAVEPRLGSARKLEDRVGLRPSRGDVRLERVDHDGIDVIHNYGHGGAGFTLSWGCANAVHQLLD